MAAIMGKDGSVRSGTTVITLVDSWSINPVIDTVEITGFTAAGTSFKSMAQTLKSWSGSFTATLDRTDTNQDSLLDQFSTATPSNVALRFYTSSVAFWSGNVLLQGAPIQSAVNDKVSLTYNFVGNGALSWTTST